LNLDYPFITSISILGAGDYSRQMGMIRKKS